MKKTNKFIFLFVFLFFHSVNGQNVPEDESFYIICPTNTTIVEKNSNLFINWMLNTYSTRNIENVKITLISPNYSYVLTTKTENDGEFIANIPENIPEGSYQIKISSIDDTLSSLSSSFTIINPIPINIVEPAKNVRWKIGKTYNISWQTEYTDSETYISLLKFNNYGDYTYYLKIAEGKFPSGKYLWQINKEIIPGKYVIAIRITPVKYIKYSQPFFIEE